MKTQPSKSHPEGGDYGILKPVSVSLQNIPEADLWELFKQERGEARESQVFNYIYLKYFPLLFRYGHQFSKDRELVKDVIQDLFVYLKVKGRRLGRTTSIKYYLYKAYRRRISRQLKKARKRLPEKDTAGERFDVALSHESKLIDSASSEEVINRLKYAIKGLTLRQREIIVYYFFQNFSYQQIASVMGFSKVQYARISLGRSVAKLRKALGDQKIP